MGLLPTPLTGILPKGCAAIVRTVDEKGFYSRLLRIQISPYYVVLMRKQPTTLINTILITPSVKPAGYNHTVTAKMVMVIT